MNNTRPIQATTVRDETRNRSAIDALRLASRRHEVATTRNIRVFCITYSSITWSDGGRIKDGVVDSDIDVPTGKVPIRYALDSHVKRDGRTGGGDSLTRRLNRQTSCCMNPRDLLHNHCNAENCYNYDDQRSTVCGAPIGMPIIGVTRHVILHQERV